MAVGAGLLLAGDVRHMQARRVGILRCLTGLADAVVDENVAAQLRIVLVSIVPVPSDPDDEDADTAISAEST